MRLAFGLVAVLGSVAVGKPITGVVRFAGTPPAPRTINADADPYCQKAPITTEDVVVTGGMLRDVVVYVSDGVPAAVATKPPAIVIDQKGCRYEPHVVAVPPLGDLTLRNSDGTFHNIHGTSGGKLVWNKPAPIGAPDLTLTPAPAVTEIACDVHPWMRAYAFAVPNLYVAVTGLDGAFTLPDLPAGHYTLTAWHPTLGTQTAKVTVRASAPRPVAFSFAAKK